jgi:chaperone modulatory protein CbpM
MCGISAELVHDMIDEGLVGHKGGDPVQWSFTLVEVRRIHRAVRLQRDLRVNLAGCALALDLLDELEELRLLLGKK